MIGLLLLLVGVIVGQSSAAISDDNDVDVQVDKYSDHNEGVMSTNVDEINDNYDDQGEQEEDEEGTDADGGRQADSDVGDNDGTQTEYEQAYEDDDDDTAKQGYGYEEPHTPHRSHERTKTKKVFVPVFVPEKEKKKMKIISVDKGFYIQGGTQIFGKFLSLKHCMKACAADSTCFQGDYNPWLHKCYKHTNYTACGKERSHPQFVHFSKVPCTVVDAPRGKVTLGASMTNGVEEKGVDSLQQCIKKCVNAGRGIPLSVSTASANEFTLQSCFAIDYDFATHKCFVFSSNIVQVPSSFAATVWTQCSLSSVTGSAQGTFPNPTVVHITFCPNISG